MASNRKKDSRPVLYQNTTFENFSENQKRKIRICNSEMNIPRAVDGSTPLIALTPLIGRRRNYADREVFGLIIKKISNRRISDSEIAGGETTDYKERKNFLSLFSKAAAIMLVMLLMIFSSGCVDQSRARSRTDTISRSTAIKDDTKDWPETTKRVVVTSMATAFIMEKLKVDLAGIPQSDVDNIPSVYRKATPVGSAMNPDVEIIRSLDPTYVFSPVSLLADLKPKYDQANLEYGFVNLNNVAGMYASIKDLGELLDRKKEASALIEEYESFMKAFNERNKGKEKKKVLILMGLPGSYVVATEYSYAGSLVKMAGGENVYTSEGEPFINVNIEDMLQRQPDVILRTAHALPDDVMEMFAKEFKENDNWKHFKAVEEDRVYDLDHIKFGMSAKFNYPEALADLEEILYAS